MEPYWDETPIHAIDFEGAPRCGIVEYGIVSLERGSVASVATRLCRPHAPIARAEQAIHGIRTDDAQGEAAFQDEWDRFATLRQSGPFAAHFASAENTMLKAVFPYPRKSPDWSQPDRCLAASWGPWLDTGGLYRNLGDNDGVLRLEDLVFKYELRGELDRLAGQHCPKNRIGYHCALYDALAAALLLALYCKELSDGRPTLGQLLMESQGSSSKRQAIQQRELF